MANYIKIVNAIHRDTALGEDDCLNHFYWRSAPDSPNSLAADVALGVAKVVDFFVAIQSWMPSAIVSNATITAWDLLESEPRVPVVETSYALAGTSAVGPMPPEVACCLSYSADNSPGVNPARRRGRVFIGPLHAETTEVVGSRVVFKTALKNDFAAAALNLAGDGDPATDPLWSVFSPTIFNSAVGTIEERYQLALAPITQGFVDGEPDIQRRRGGRTHSRTAWNL